MSASLSAWPCTFMAPTRSSETPCCAARRCPRGSATRPCLEPTETKEVRDKCARIRVLMLACVTGSKAASRLFSARFRSLSFGAIAWMSYKCRKVKRLACSIAGCASYQLVCVPFFVLFDDRLRDTSHVFFHSIGVFLALCQRPRLRIQVTEPPSGETRNGKMSIRV
jgi:hypothetical protein